MISVLFSVFAIIFSVYIAFQKCDREELKLLLSILAVAFIPRIIVIAMHVYGDFFPTKYFIDALAYHRHAISILRGDEIIVNTSEIKHFAYLISVIYGLFGPSLLVAQLLMSVVSLVSAANVYLIFVSFLNKKWAAFGTLMFSMLPPYLMISSHLFRDNIVILFITSVLLLLCKYEKENGRNLFTYFSGIFILSFGLCFYRPHQALVILMALVTIGILSFVHVLKDRRLFKKRLALGLAALSVLFAMVLSDCNCVTRYRPLYDGYFFKTLRANRINMTFPEHRVWKFNETTKKYDISLPSSLRVPWRAGGNGTSSTSYPSLTWGDQSEYSDGEYLFFFIDKGWLLRTLTFPLKFIEFLFFPFPWSASKSVFFLLAKAENIIVAFLVVLSFLWFVRSGWRYLLYVNPMAVYFVGSLVLYSLASGNVGTGMRHRVQFIWILLIPGLLFLKSYFEERIRDKLDL